MSILNDFLKDEKYWKLLIINQKIGQSYIFKMLRHIKTNCPEEEKVYVELIFKFQINK